MPTTLRLTASDPETALIFEEWNELLTMYAAMLNPQCFVNLAGVIVNSPEYRADVAEWRAQVEEMFQELTR